MSFYLNYVPSGLLFSALIVSTRVNLVRRRPIEKTVSELHQLSEEGKAILAAAERWTDSDRKRDDVLPMSWADKWHLFANSRLHLCIANRAHQDNPEDKEIASYLQVFRDEHRNMWGLLVRHTFGWLPWISSQKYVYLRAYVYTYESELALLEFVAERCPPIQAQLIRAVL